MENEEKPNYSTQKEEPVMPTPPPPIFPTPAHHFPKFLLKPITLIVIILIVGSLLSGLVFTVYTLGRNSVLKELNPTAPTVPPADPDIFQGTPTPGPTADWQIYSGDYYSFKYPKSWIPYALGEEKGTYSIPNDGQGEYFLSPLNVSDTGIHFIVSPTKDTSKEIMEDAIKNYSWTNKVISNIEVNGVSAIKVTGNSNGSENAVVVFGNGIYIYKIQSGGKEIDIFNQIISTFKFTESSVGDPQILSDAIKELGENYALVKINTLYGENYALGSARFENGFGGLEFVAHKENGSWKIIHKGTESPGCSKFTNYPDFPKNLCSPEY